MGKDGHTDRYGEDNRPISVAKALEIAYAYNFWRCNIFTVHLLSE
jgi:hypothetical protein